jgi:hypothetical protein
MASTVDMAKRGGGRRWKRWPIGESEGECNLHISSRRCRCDPIAVLELGSADDVHTRKRVKGNSMYFA